MDKEKETVQQEQQENANHKASESQNSKHEEVPSVDDKKQSKEKTYTQAQVDAMMAKARKKYKKNDIKEEQTEDTQQDTQESQRDLSTGITVEKLAQAELKAEMAIQGITPQKVARAVRLIDVNDVLDETGQYSEKKAQEAIEELLKEWPELKQTSQKERNSFDFGAPEQKEQDPQQNTKGAISKIFGNQEEILNAKYSKLCNTV